MPTFPKCVITLPPAGTSAYELMRFVARILTIDVNPEAASWFQHQAEQCESRGELLVLIYDTVTVASPARQ